MMPLLIVQMIFLMFLLMINGEPLRFFLLRRLRLFSDLDFIQICILDVYCGGLIFYVVAMLPFRLFSWFVVLGFTVSTLFISAFIHFKALTRVASFSKLKAFLTENKKAFFDYVLVLAMFIVFLLINFLSLSDLVFGSVRDESMHSLNVQVILENNCVPSTLQPYLQEGIIYPQASHVIFAFASYMLNMEVTKAVFYVSILFKSLSIFGAYFLGKKIGSRRAYYLGLSFVFAFISSWPLYIAWGGNPFLVGFPLFLVSLGLLFSMLSFHGKNSFAELITVGLLFGYASTIMVSYLQTLIVIIFWVFVYWFVKRYDSMRRNMLEFAIVFLVSLLPLSPFLFRFFAFYPYPGHNIGVPSDFSGWPRSQLYVTQALQWAFENLSPYVLLRVITMLLLFGLILLLWKTKDYKNVKPAVAFALAIFVAASSLSLISFFLPADFTVISWGHQGAILTVPINIFLVTFYIKLADFCRKCKSKRLSEILPKNSYSTLLLTVTLFPLITAPFLYYRFLVDPATLRGTYGVFAVTTQDDYDLMTWMKGNLSSDAVILVNPYEAGLFIPSISHHRIIFPFSGSSFSGSYQTLVSLLNDNVLNETTYELMQYWGVSHVFVASSVAYWWLEDLKWDPKLFLGNPNFELVKNFGDSYLFEQSYKNASIVFMDDFEYTLWNQSKWQTLAAGSGIGNVSITTDFGYDGSRCLRMTAQVTLTAKEWKYAQLVRREIFVLNDSRVTLSFFFNAAEGFDTNNGDTFAVLVSDVDYNQSIVITTHNGIYKNYKNAIWLDRVEGFFGDFDLSAAWGQMFNSSLPNPFILEFVNYDFDGIKNVAYVDNITVTSTPLD